MAGQVVGHHGLQTCRWWPPRCDTRGSQSRVSPGSGAGGASTLRGVLEQSWGQGCHLLGTSVSSPTPGQDTAGRELTASLGVTNLRVTPPDSSSMGRCHLYSMFA